MVFSSMTFLLLFLPVVLLLYFLAPGLKGKNAVLICASLLFYAWGEPVCVLAMLASTAVNYACARLIGASQEPRKRKAACAVGVGVSLALLGYFKYFAFLLENLAALFSLSVTVPQPGEYGMPRRLHSVTTSSTMHGDTMKSAPIWMYRDAVGASTTEPIPRASSGHSLLTHFDSSPNTS